MSVEEPDGEQAECGDVNEVFGPGIGPVCTEPAGHDGDHIATDRTQTRPGYPGGTVVSRWENIAQALLGATIGPAGGPFSQPDTAHAEVRAELMKKGAGGR